MAAVEVGEVDARAEDPPPRVARVLDDAAAEDADLDLRVEQREVDRDLGRAERRVVLGVEVARVAQLEHPRPPLAAQRSGPEVGDAAGAEVVEALERLRGRAQHRPHEVRARGGRGEHVREQQALRDLEPLLVGERPRVLGLQRLARRHQPGHALRRTRQQRLEPQRPAAAVGQLVVERVGVDAQEALARPVGILAAALQVRGEGRAVAVELAGEGGLDGGHATPAGCGSGVVCSCTGAGGNARCSNSSYGIPVEPTRPRPSFVPT